MAELVENDTNENEQYENQPINRRRASAFAIEYKTDPRQQEQKGRVNL